MRQFVHQGRKFLLRAQAMAHQNAIAADAAMHAVGQRRTQHLRAGAPGIGLQGLNQHVDRGHAMDSGREVKFIIHVSGGGVDNCGPD